MIEKIDRDKEPAASVAPVFQGLAEVGVSGKDIAAALRVSDASVSKWRNGRITLPDETKVFLSLIIKTIPFYSL